MKRLLTILLTLVFPLTVCGQSPVVLYNATLLSGDITSGTYEWLVIDIDDETDGPHDSSTSAEVQRIILSASATSNWKWQLGKIVDSETHSATAAVACQRFIGSGITNLDFSLDDTLRLSSAAIAGSSVSMASADPILGSATAVLNDIFGNSDETAAEGDWLMRVEELDSGTLDLAVTLIYGTK